MKRDWLSSVVYGFVLVAAMVSCANPEHDRPDEADFYGGWQGMLETNQDSTIFRDCRRHQMELSFIGVKNPEYNWVQFDQLPRRRLEPDIDGRTITFTALVSGCGWFRFEGEIKNGNLNGVAAEVGGPGSGTWLLYRSLSD